jgi:putative sterol carrier protein
VRYASSQWIEAAGRALAGDAGLKDATVDVRLTLEQVVTGAPGGTVRWHVTIDHGRVDVAEGPAASPSPGLRFTASYDTAAQIASGALGAQRAFAEGRLRVGGDLSLLVAHHRTLVSLDDALAAVRAETTYEDEPRS